MKTAARSAAVLALLLAFSALAVPEQTDPARQDAAVNPIRRARTGHLSNYDEAKVGEYKLPDPLVLADGRAVRDSKTWNERRRAEILELYKAHVYGRVPAR